MFDYRVSKHPHFDEACRAFALRHNMAKLAERAGMNVQTLRNKLNEYADGGLPITPAGSGEYHRIAASA